MYVKKVFLGLALLGVVTWAYSQTPVSKKSFFEPWVNTHVLASKFYQSVGVGFGLDHKYLSVLAEGSLMPMMGGAGITVVNMGGGFNVRGEKSYLNLILFRTIHGGSKDFQGVCPDEEPHCVGPRVYSYGYTISLGAHIILNSQVLLGVSMFTGKIPELWQEAQYNSGESYRSQSFGGIKFTAGVLLGALIEGR